MRRPRGFRIVRGAASAAHNPSRRRHDSVLLSKCVLTDLAQGTRPRRALFPFAVNPSSGAGTMAKIPWLAAALACGMGVAASAAPQPPVAVVEEVTGKLAGLQFMDYV